MSKRYAIYIRVSTKEQANGDGRSPQNQEHRCRSYIHSQGDDPLEEKRAVVFSDIGHSGKTLERPAFAKMMRAVKRGEIHTIIFTELSRISRSVMDFLGLVEQLNEAGVNFISIKEQYNTSTAVGRLLMTMIMALNAFEREQVSERTRLGMLARSERGLWNGVIPLGYKPGGDKGYLKVDESAVPLVKQIYELYDQLGSISKVERYLKENQIYRPDRYNRFGKLTPAHPFRDNSLRAILTAPVYLGLREINKKSRHLNQEELSDDQKYKIVKGVWEPIIEEDLAQRVRDRIEFNRENYGVKSQLVGHDFILNSFLYCDECGEQLIRECAKGNRYYYYNHPKPHSTCSKKRWRAAEVEFTVFSHLMRLADDPEAFDAMVRETERQQEERSRDVPEQLESQQAQLEELNGQKNTLMLNLRTKTYAEIPQGMIEESTRLDEEIAGVKSEMSTLRERLTRVKHNVTQVREIREKVLNVRSALLNPERYQLFRLLRETLGGVFLRGDTMVRALLLNEHKPTDLLGFMSYKQEKRPDSSYQTALKLPLLDLNQRHPD